MTEYLVLVSTPIDSQQSDWREIAKVSARSATSAIREALAGDKQAVGKFVAVPARSWKPVTVKVETKTALKFS